MTTPERYERISSLFLAAADLDPPARAALLDRECDGDAELRDAVLRMLAHEASALAAPVAPLVPAELADPLPAAFGNYRILETLGRGGMGTVYRAEQLRPRRIVALKVIRADRTTPEIARRFASEAEILGSLRHPGIAQILEAGSIPGPHGELPFIAMEWIDGLPLLASARERALGTRERLELLSRVCEAVEFAHRRGVVHRDLKPDNILVEANGRPKVLDFGIARVTDPALRSATRTATLRTEAGQLLGTLPYMSPEQVAGGEIDPRTDVYSLGVIGYELLGGRRPHDLADSDLESALRTIRDETPAPLDRIDPALRGDVATIIGKALEKEPARRYGTAGELAADIERHLSARPVLARPPSRLYQVERFARRNRVLVAGTLATVIALVAGLAGTLWMALEATRERDIAREQTEVAVAVKQFLELDILRQADPLTTPDRNLTVREAFDRAATSVGGRFVGRPRVEAAIRMTIGSTYLNLGLPRVAQVHLDRADALARDLLPRDHEDRLRAGLLRAKCHDLSGDHIRALARVEALLADFPAEPRGQIGELRLDSELLRSHSLAALGSMVEATEAAERLRAPVLATFGPWSGAMEQVETTLASYARDEGRFADAQAIFDSAAERARRELGPDNPITLRRELDAATCLYHAGRNAEALPIVEVLLVQHRHVLGEEHPRTIQSLRLLSRVLENLDERERAAELRRQVLDVRRRALGEDHPDTLTSWAEEALMMKNEGRLAEAQPIYERVLAARLATLSPGHPDVTNIRNNLAMLHRSAGRYDEARKLLENSLTSSLESVGPDHPATLRTRYYLGFTLRNLDRLEAAEEQYRLAFAGQEARLGVRHPDTQLTMFNLAMLERRLERYDESEALFLRLIPASKETYGATHENVAVSVESLGSLYLDRGEPARAIPCYEEAIAARTASVGEEAVITQSTALRLWRALDELDRHAEALPVAERAVGHLREPRGPGRNEGRKLLANALLALGRSRIALGALAEAETALLEARSIHAELGAEGEKEVRQDEHWLHLLYERWGRAEEAARYHPLPGME